MSVDSATRPDKSAAPRPNRFRGLAITADNHKADLMRSLNQEYLIEGILPDGMELGALWGKPKTGKSFLALDMALSLAAGIDWHGHKVLEPRPVLYIACDGQASSAKRIKAWLKKHGLERLPEGFYLLPFPVALDDKRSLQTLIATLKELEKACGRFALAVVDTLARCMRGNENSARDMKRFVQGCGTIHRASGASVLVVHQSGKNETKGMRGNSSWHGGIEAELHVSQKGHGGVITLRCNAFKDAEPFEPMEFELEPASTGREDADGEVVFSRVPALWRNKPRNSAPPPPRRNAATQLDDPRGILQ